MAQKFSRPAPLTLRLRDANTAWKRHLVESALLGAALFEAVACLDSGCTSSAACSRLVSPLNEDWSNPAHTCARKHMQVRLRACAIERVRQYTCYPGICVGMRLDTCVGMSAGMHTDMCVGMTLVQMQW